jgi:hypothetical protein
MGRESPLPSIAIGIPISAPSAKVVRRSVAGIRSCGAPSFAIENIEGDSGTRKRPQERENPSGGQSSIELVPTEDEGNEDQGELDPEVGVPQ